MIQTILLRKIAGRLTACFRNGFGLAPATARSCAPSLLAIACSFAMFLFVPILALATIAVLAHAQPHLGAAALAIVPAALPAPLQAKQADLAKILTELEAGQKEMAAGAITQARGEELDAKAAEAEKIQKEIDQFKRLSGLTARGREAVDPVLPDATEGKGAPSDVVGYLSLGEAFTQSPEFKAFAERGFPSQVDVLSAMHGVVESKSGQLLLPVTRDMIERKAVTVGAGVLRAERDSELVRFAEQQPLVIRDLLSVAPTGASSVEYVTIASATRAADTVAEGAVKPEGGLVYGTGNAPVRTIAVVQPVTEQQLQDVPEIQSTIDSELTWDLKKKEEEQIVWGDGLGQNLLGIMNTPGVSAGRTVAGDTFIDLARRMMTDVITAGLQPNGIVVDPLDWETMVLTKGTDENYVWAVVTDSQGSRIWGARVVETIAAREPGSYTTNERRLIVGDFRRGAKLWDRQQKAVQIGWINDQFTRNQRTIRVEERVAFGVRRPAAFLYRITQARVA